ncbi:MAG: LytTR family DNA-binding domain-containing protein [Cyclobacteriaceae bacterium]|nr:response regulator transcription factor [Cyclobacteriaceae bacterium]
MQENYSVLIVEDEPMQATMLQDLLSESHPELKLLGVATSIAEAQEMLKHHSPDLVFLDVMLPPHTSFDLLQSLPTIDFEIIFTTSFEEFAVRAFRLSAVDYLVKPVAKGELDAAITKFKQKKGAKEGLQHLKVLLDNVNASRSDQEKIALPTFTGFVFVAVKDILRCESDNTYTTFHLTNGKNIIVSRTLKECEQLLSDHRFCRVHNSHLVNLGYVTEYIRGEGGQVKLTDGTFIDVSRRKKEEFLLQLKRA